MALASSHTDRPVRAGTVVFGEVGLTGEIRPVRHAATRLRESARLGFRRAVVAGGDGAQAEILQDSGNGMHLEVATSVRQAVALALAT